MNTRSVTVREAGRRGGKTRAERLTKEQRTEIATKGSRAAAKWYEGLSPEEKTERARKANLASHEAKRRKKGNV